MLTVFPAGTFPLTFTCLLIPNLVTINLTLIGVFGINAFTFTCRLVPYFSRRTRLIALTLTALLFGCTLIFYIRAL